MDCSQGQDLLTTWGLNAIAPGSLFGRWLSPSTGMKGRTGNEPVMPVPDQGVEHLTRPSSEADAFAS